MIPKTINSHRMTVIITMRLRMVLIVDCIGMKLSMAHR
jgi:hypothetical protein